jgi:hypothetical protein
MPGVQDDQAHALQHSLLDAVDDRIGDLAVRHVTPPRQDIRPRQTLRGEPVLRFLQRRRFHAGLGRAFPDRLGNRLVHPPGIDGGHLGMALFMDVLTPDHHAKRRHGGAVHAASLGLQARLHAIELH